MTIKLIPHKPERIVGLNIDGKIVGEDIDRVVQLIEERLKKEQKLRIYAEIENWSGMSLKAFIKDFMFSLRHFRDFEKEAIVSDRQWLKNLAAVSNKLLSNIEVKHFTFADKDRALEWIAS